MYNSIHAMRGIASLVVVFMHVMFQQLWYEQNTGMQESTLAHFYNLKSIGGAGVHIFFIISGFVLATSVNRSKNITAGNFFLKRLIRVAPLYTLATVSAYFLVTSPEQQSLLLLLSSLAYIPIDGQYPIIGYGWSLNYEMWFYVAFSLSLIFKNRYFVCSSIMLFIVWSKYSIGTFPFSFYGEPIVIEFLIGVIISKIHKSPEIKYMALPLAISGSLMMFCTIFYLPASSVVSIPAVIGWGIPGAIIILGLASYEHNYGLAKISSPLKILGDVSYSLYLTHWIFLKLISTSWASYGNYYSWLGSDITAIIVIFACVIASIPIHYLFEKPIGKILDEMIKTSKKLIHVK